MAAKLTLNKSTINLIRAKAFNDKKVKRDFRVLAERQFKRAHKKLMVAFEGHSVTQELKQGPGGSNVTGTLKSGNLFGFIGFDSNHNPITPLRKALSQANILIHKSNRKTFSYTFRVHMPTIEELYEITPLPWATGSSWLYALERKGISNLGQYAFKESPNSRSGAGVQTNSTGGGVLKISYLIPILKEFEQDVSSIAGFKIK
jgi:hypothetical protein